jgi:predicted  nucleic acid-binding Zn-ribbon protein
MLEVIEKLLILQDRDRKIRRVEAELAHIEPERKSLLTKASGTQANLEAGKNRGRQIESDRKRLELDVEAKKNQIERYANQQLQTRKNEEYKALAHEIEMCKAEINKIEDQQIALMEQAEAAQKEVVRLTQEAAEAKKHADQLVVQLGEREQNFRRNWPNCRAIGLNWPGLWTKPRAVGMSGSRRAKARMSWWASITASAAVAT